MSKFQARSLHTTASLYRKRATLEPVKPPEPELALDGEIVPQSRLSDILSHLGEEEETPLLQKTEIELEPFVVNEVLDVGRHTKILPGGRIMTFSALVLIGTGKGTAGMGRSRAETVTLAVSNATAMAKKSLVSIIRNRGCSISRDNIYKYKRTKVVVRACRTGYGIRASPEMRVMLQAFGLEDICVTTVGRTTNRQAMYRAIFKGLQDDVRTAPMIAKALGKKIFDLHAFYYSPRA
jgi:ribosomal protein S5